MTSSSVSTASFLWLSDIHLDPYYGGNYAAKPTNGCTNGSLYQDYPLGRYGCDAPRALVDSAMASALSIIGNKINEHARNDGDVQFMIITGDICRHGTDELEDPMYETEHILKGISGPLSNTSSSTIDNLNIIKERGMSVIPSIGNNDVIPDYFLNTTSYEEGTSNSMLETIVDGLSPLFYSIDEKETFRRGGYLVRTIGEKLTILSLNTIIYSTSHMDAAAAGNDDHPNPDPFGQFQWMEEQLEIAFNSSRYVYMIGHIPPTVGSYRHTQLWKKQYLVKYYKIYDRFKQVIKGQFFGHLHTDEFRIPDVEAILTSSCSNDGDNCEDHYDDYDTHDEGPVLWIASSITPIYGSNPSIRQVFYETVTGEVLDYDTYYLNLTDPQILMDWQQNNEQSKSDTSNWIKDSQSFKESFGLQNVSKGSLKRGIVDALGSNTQSPFWNVLIERQHIYMERDLTDTETLRETLHMEWICTFSSITTEQYQECLALKSRAEEGRSNFIIFMAAAMLVTAAVILSVFKSWSCIKNWRRRRYQLTNNLEREHGQQGTHSTIEMNSAAVTSSIPEII